ncbi:metallophosphoesterase [Candidatus Dojkabacteria bacterium]|uniref:Metallophosphoesterase n=1 Tax=Candidatus Dojkabacteria bacterium TaxID=2099670 RepID=A0A955L5G9_9BACT|nr:metallophosphoesterase [Candidatus Dojkabacteria bacterium]
MTFTEFDKITLLFIGLGFIAEMILLVLTKKFNKLKQYFSTLIILIILCQALLIYGSYIEPRWIDVRHENIQLNENGNSELKVVIVSDFHVGPYKQDDFVAKAVEKINEQNPDLVLMPGDFIYSYPDQADFLYPLADLEAELGVYAVLGNHDYGVGRKNKDDYNAEGAIAKSEYVVQKLEEFGVTVLRNEIVEIDHDNKLKLLGLEDIWGSRFDFNMDEFDISDDDTVIFLEHNPDIVLYDEAEFSDLIISGHTHGGQIRLPFWGPVPELPTVLGKEYDYGQFEYEGKQLYITKGIGEMGPRARLFARPEIVVVKLSY